MDQYPDGTIADGPNGPIIFQGGQWQPMAGPPQSRPMPRAIPIPQSPTKIRKDQGDIAQTGASTTNTQTKTAETAAGLPYVAPLAAAKASQAGTEANSAARMNGLPAETFNKALSQWNAALELDRIIADMRVKFSRGPGATHGVAGIKDFLWSPENQAFDKTSSQARGVVRNAIGLTGGENNTLGEMNMNMGGYIPDSSNFDSTNSDIFTNLEGVRDNARRMAIQTLGGIPDANGNIAPMQAQNAMTQTDLSDAGGMSAAPAGSRQKQSIIPPEMQQEYNAFMSNWGGDPEEYAQGRAAIDRKYGYGINDVQMEEFRNWARDQSDKLRNGGTLNTRLHGPTEKMSNLDQFRNNLVNNPAGAAAAGFADMAGFGGVSALAPGQMQSLGDANPIAMPLGQIAGAIAGTSALGSLGRNTLGRAFPSLMAGGGKAAFGRNLAADTAFGGLYGGVSEGDPVTGALAAGMGSGAGQVVGKGLGTALGGIQVNPMVQALLARKIPMTVGQTLGGFGKTIEDAMTSIPGVGDLVNARRLEGLRGFNREALSDAGAPVGASTRQLGNAGVDDLTKQIGEAYDNATAGVQVPLDPQFFTDMAAAGRAGTNLPADLAARFDAAGANRVAPIVDAGHMTGEAYQQANRGIKGYKAEATRPGFENDYRDALGGVQNAMRSQMERGGGASVVKALAAADKAYRMAKTLKRATGAAKNGTGSGEVQIFTPAQLNTADYQSAAKYGSRQFGDLADAGQSVLPSKIPDSGTGRRMGQMMIGATALGSGIGGTAGAMGSPNPGSGALAGGGTGAVSGAALASLLAIGGTRAGQRLITKALTGRPDAMKTLGTKIRKHQGLFGAAAVPLSIESTK